jgi:hypothetical protein
MALVSERHQRVHTRFGTDDNTATVAAVTTAGPASRHVLFSAECHTTISAPTSNGFDFDAVDEHDERSDLGKTRSTERR